VKKKLQSLLDRSPALERPGGIVNGPELGRRRIYGVAECHGRKGGLFSHHTLTYVRAD
jgi:hypothetical protein